MTGGATTVQPEGPRRARGPSEPERPPELEAISGRRFGGKELAIGMLFLLPALVVLGAIVVYPIFFTVYRSLYDRAGDTFVGIENYVEMFSRDATLTAIQNMIIWIVAAPILATTLGLIFAVLTERVALGTAFKTVIFMPMAISFLASGVIFRLVYDEDPDKGLANAVLTGIVDIWEDEGQFRGARPVDGDVFEALDPGFVTQAAFAPGDTVSIGLVALPQERIPEDAAAAAQPSGQEGALTGTVWLDFTPGGGGETGVIDSDEVGLPGMVVQAVNVQGDVIAETETDPDGTFALEGIDEEVSVRLAPQSFEEPWDGIVWLGETQLTPVGPAIVTMSVIVAFLWIWSGFAMMVIAAGLSSIPEEVQEAARVDGGTEWQVFRRVTVPLLWPVLLVVAVTLVINVLKIFDLVLIIPPGSVQAEANVIALELWRVSFGGARDFGLGSALGVLLFVLVVPFMLFNIRRFRREEG